MLKTEIIGLVYQLLPGFIAAWIFYGLTAHPRKSEFERVVQALIFTGIIKAMVILLGALLLLLGRNGIRLGVWGESTEYAVSCITAVMLGVLFSACANTNAFHARMPRWITKRTSYPSEWFSTFNQEVKYVYLHLKDGRRIYGYPLEWPDAPDSGHFVLMYPKWIADDNAEAPLLLTDKMLVPSKSVVFVEFEKDPSEWHTVDWNAHTNAVNAMVELHRLEDAKETTGAAAAPAPETQPVVTQPQPPRRSRRRKNRRSERNGKIPE